MRQLYPRPLALITFLKSGIGKTGRYINEDDGMGRGAFGAIGCSSSTVSTSDAGGTEDGAALTLDGAAIPLHLATPSPTPRIPTSLPSFTRSATASPSLSIARAAPRKARSLNTAIPESS